MVDVQPPDLETKMAILDKKAELEGVALPEEVRIYIATKTKSNVRELEGALIKLIAYSSITSSPVTLQMAQQVLKYLISGGERRITMDSILRAVAEKFNMQPQQLKQKSNARQISYPRQVAMYLMKDLTQASLPEIGRRFWRQASHYRSPFRPENRTAAPDRYGSQQVDPQPNRLSPLVLFTSSTTRLP